MTWVDGLGIDPFMQKGQTVTDVLGYVPAGAGQAYRFLGDECRLLTTSEDTGGSSCTLEVIISPNRSYAPHKHEDTDEQMYILDGLVTMHVGENTFDAGPGDLVFIPRGTVHSLDTSVTAMKMLVTYTPGGVERIIRERGEAIRG